MDEHIVYLLRVLGDQVEQLKDEDMKLIVNLYIKDLITFCPDDELLEEKILKLITQLEGLCERDVL